MDLTTQAQASAPVLEVTDLRTIFRFRGGTIFAVNGISFRLDAGELLAVVGESGSGKSVAMMSLMQLLPMPPAEIVSGRCDLPGADLVKLDETAIRQVRGARIGFIFQDPMTSLNPVFTVGYQIMEPLRAHLGMSRAQGARARHRAAGAGRHPRRPPSGSTIIRTSSPAACASA